MEECKMQKRNAATIGWMPGENPNGVARLGCTAIDFIVWKGKCLTGQKLTSFEKRALEIGLKQYGIPVRVYGG